MSLSFAHTHMALPPRSFVRCNSSPSRSTTTGSTSSWPWRNSPPPMEWAAAHWLTGGRNFTCASYSKQGLIQTSFVRMSVKSPYRPIARGTVWPYLLPRRFIYSSNLSDIDTVQLSELWAKTLKVRRDPQKIGTALRHSYAFVVVLEQGEELENTTGFRKKIVGFGRAVSDGAFVATICDVAVDPNYQRKGIGRRIVKELVQNMKRKGGPTGFAVFPPPFAKRFFWMIGFRSERKFKFMAYRGRLIDAVNSVDFKNVQEGFQELDQRESDL